MIQRGALNEYLSDTRRWVHEHVIFEPDTAYDRGYAGVEALDELNGREQDSALLQHEPIEEGHQPLMVSQRQHMGDILVRAD